MQTKIVYIVVSNDSDIYLEQSLLSMYSLRIHNPDTEIILIVDDLTDATIKGQRSNILKYITSKVVVDINEKYNSLQRSRILKTSMRKYVEGSFLYIDNDTIITSSLVEIDNFSYDIGAVKELHLPSFRSQYDFVKIKKISKNLPAKLILILNILMLE
jgi:lipopolysaccharide biosynthesis glycosyltransferase